MITPGSMCALWRHLPEAREKHTRKPSQEDGTSKKLTLLMWEN
jgi:hypothetical protein